MLTDEKINEIFDLDPNIKQGDWKGYKRAALVMAPRAIKQAVREEMAKQEPVAFLLNGSRFKLSFQSICCEACGAEHDRVSCEPLGMYANELQGAWVALVPAENDRHIRMVAPVVPDCKQCSNRGRIYGLTQKTFCEHCRWQNAESDDLFVATAGKQK
jgi:hypothetical protein